MKNDYFLNAYFYNGSKLPRTIRKILLFKTTAYATMKRVVTNNTMKGNAMKGDI